MKSFELLGGSCLDILSLLPTESVQCCITSPPYWGLRDYRTGSWDGGDAECDHTTDRFTNPVSENQASNTASGSKQASKVCPKCGAQRTDAQIGLEPTLDEYVEKMVVVFREVWRVLRSDGTLWLNLGDSYAGGSGGNTRGAGAGGGQERGVSMGLGTLPKRKDFTNGTKPKDLCGVPWRVAFALQADGWYLRQDIIWAKPNPMPESVTDRCTKAHEYIFLLTKQAKYYYDAEAVKELATVGDGLMRNKRSVWTVTTKPYREAHFATFPPDLIEPCVLAGSKPGDTLLDPFNGAGTTGVVAVRHGRRYIGVELNPDYLEMSRKRIQAERDGITVPMF